MSPTTARSAEASPSAVRPVWRSGTAGMGEALRRLGTPLTLLVLAASTLLLLACNVMVQVGPRAVVFKHFYPRAYVLVVVLASAGRLSAVPAPAWRSLRTFAGRALVVFGLLMLLIGASRLVSNGVTYAEMASNYWSTDPFNSTSRRLGMPVLAHVLGFEKNGYVFFWYATLFASVASALAVLDRSRLLGLEKLSLLTSSILAYALVGPGYNEIFVLMLGCVALLRPTTMVEKIVLATMMLATHETATAFAALTLIAATEGEERAGWVAVFGLLYLLYVAAYLFVWRGETLHALFTASKASPGETKTSPELAVADPAWTLLGVFLAYKLYWLLLPAGLLRRGLRPIAGVVVLSLVLAIVGTDTSRLVEFSTLAVVLLATRILPGWPRRLRIALAVANLVVPSLYVATNSPALWGRGLYSAYLYAADAAGLDWGLLFPVGSN